MLFMVHLILTCPPIRSYIFSFCSIVNTVDLTGFWTSTPKHLDRKMISQNTYFAVTNPLNTNTYKPDFRTGGRLFTPITFKFIYYNEM